MEELALPLKAGVAAPFFFGDNLDGYYEGVAFREAAGAGYVVRGRAVLRDFASWRDDRENFREKADGAKLYPYGIRHQHGPLTWDELIILRHRRAVALRAHSERTASLALAPLFELRGEEPVFATQGGLVVMTLPQRGLHIAFAASQPFTLEARLERQDLFMPVFRTLQPANEFTLYVAFASAADRALVQAERFRQDDAVAQHQRYLAEFIQRSNLWTSDEDYNRALAWAKLTSHFLVAEDPGHGIWAGLPWFRENWGRDTFIALPGTLLVTGQFEAAREVLRQFARWQNTDPKSPDHGRIPNRVRGPQDVIYNTVDGTPWFLRAVHAYLDYTGDTTFAQEIYPVVARALDAALQQAVDQEGFLTHADADTWMDARIEGQQPWSPRGNRACEVQALWHAALHCGITLADRAGAAKDAARWTKAADLVRKNFAKRFWDPKKKVLADRLAADGTPDLRVRPNQLLALSLLEDEIAEAVVRKAVGELLFPYGICSLSPADPWFHPRHDGQAGYHKDAAYHNGTIWGWNAGFTISALVRHGQVELAGQLATNLADQILHRGHRGTMSELLDAWPNKKNKPVPSGTWAQAWSTAEFARNAGQDFLGFRPRLLEDRIELAPALPAAWTKCSATLPFGHREALLFNAVREKGREVFLLKFEGPRPPAAFQFSVAALGRRFTFDFQPQPADTMTIVVDARGALVSVNGQWWPKPVVGRMEKPPKPLAFAKPDPQAKPPCLSAPDYLRSLLLAPPPARKSSRRRSQASSTRGAGPAR